MAQPPGEWTVLSMMEWATEFFEEKEVNSPRLSIEWLLAHVLGIRRLDLYLNYDRPLSKEELDALRPLVKRRSVHEPLQYLTGYTDFYNARIEVNKNVLIPRQETEQLVELILDSTPQDQPLKVLDLGTGSGCIPIALKMERPEWQVLAADISEEALSLARRNAELNEAPVLFFNYDFCSSQEHPQLDQFDLIVSNPPYIPEEERDAIDREVRDFEPGLALFCEEPGFIYQKISEFCTRHLRENGTAFFEIHEERGPETLRVFSESGWKCTLQKDLSDKDRFIIINR